ncbi:uncharacterized protein UDID_19455 [Ustilago sp. UG-2017a]|nr:uncharacterized protein UDID_19455 [Ustilago sp. UG-2017a]
MSDILLESTIHRIWFETTLQSCIRKQNNPKQSKTIQKSIPCQQAPKATYIHEACTENNWSSGPISVLAVQEGISNSFDTNAVSLVDIFLRAGTKCNNDTAYTTPTHTTPPSSKHKHRQYLTWAQSVGVPSDAKNEKVYIGGYKRSHPSVLTAS